MKNKPKYCKTCILKSTTPGVVIDKNGYCQYCTSDKKSSEILKYRIQLLKLIDSVIIESKNKKRKYDVLVFYSGGKDSTYLLYELKNKYKLNPLAFFVNHPCSRKQQLINVKNVTKKLNVDLKIFKIDEEVFRKTMKHTLLHEYKKQKMLRLGCRVCSAFHTWIIGYRYALEHKIPLVAIGYDLSQILFIYGPGNLLRKNLLKKDIAQRIIEKACGDSIKGTIYFSDFKKYKEDEFPEVIHPLAIWPYDGSKTQNFLQEKKIINQRREQCC